jgi:hypothetical protein
VASCVSVALATQANAQSSARDTLPAVRKIHIEGNEAFSDK